MNWCFVLFLWLSAPLWIPIVLVVAIVVSAFLPLFTDTTRADRAREAVKIRTRFTVVGDKRVPR